MCEAAPAGAELEIPVGIAAANELYRALAALPR